MTSSDRDQTSFDRYGRTVRRAYAPFRLSADQRQRHHVLLDEAARRRATGRLRPHLAEATAIATIALLVIIALVTWRALQPENEEQIAAPATTAEPTISGASPVDDRSTEPQALYMLKDGDVVGIDPVTGEEILHIDVNNRFDPYAYLAVSHESGRVAVSLLLGDEENLEPGIKIYRMTDGALEQEIPVPTIQRCHGGPCINITFSQDGQLIHVQQSDAQSGTSGNLVAYWLGTFDLNQGKWLADVDLEACTVSNYLETIGPDEVIALCSKAGLYVVDTERFTARSAGYRLNNAAMVAYDDTFIVAYDDRTICEQPRDGDHTTATCHSAAKLVSEDDFVLPSANLGISPDRTQLYVPTGTKDVPEDSRHNWITSEITVISTETWHVERTIDVGFSFSEIVFSEDASTAYAVSEHEGDIARLVRIDLATGDQTELESGAISSVVIAPRWDEELVATTPTSTTEPDDAGQLDYVFRDGDVVGLDPETGEEVQHIDVNTSALSPFLAVSYESGRIAVGGGVRLRASSDQLGSPDGTQYGVKIYRMSDGSLEQQIPVASLVSCREDCEGLILSQDGRRVHVYQLNWPGGADASSIRYLLTTYDLETQEWLEDVDLGSCGLVDSWGFVDDHILRIGCSDSEPVDVNTATFTVETDPCDPVETPDSGHPCYTFRDGDVIGIDRETNEEVQHIDVNIGSQSPFLAVSYESGRIAVGDFLRNGDEVELGVKIYRMSDGTLEQEIPVPTLIRCLGPCEGIIFSQDGQRLHIYQYEIPPEANGNSDLANYWLGTFGLESREWMQDVDMESCGVVLNWRFIDDEVLQVDCGKSSPVEIDTSTFIRYVNANPDRADRSELLPHERMYTVDANGLIKAIDLESGDTLFDIQGGPDTDIALSPDGATIYWIGAESLVAADAITGAETWRARVSYEERARWIMGLGPSTLAVSPDGERLYLSATDPEEIHRYTVRIYDTISGEVIGETNPFEVELVGTNGVEGNSLCAPHLFPSPSGDRLLTPCSGRFNFYLFDTESSEILQKAGIPAAGSVASSVASPDGSLAYIVTSNGFIAVMDTETAELVDSAELFSAVQPARLALALSPDGSRLYVPVSSHGEQYGTSDIYVYDTDTWEELDRISLDFFMDGQTLAVDSAGNVYGVRTIDDQGSALWRCDAETREITTEQVTSSLLQHIHIVMPED